MQSQKINGPPCVSQPTRAPTSLGTAVAPFPAVVASSAVLPPVPVTIPVPPVVGGSATAIPGGILVVAHVVLWRGATVNIAAANYAI